MKFESREHAGQKLGEHLVTHRVSADLVLGLPRGGVVVAAQVARLLELPLEAMIVRKVGHPRFREFAVGALAESDIVLIDNSAIEMSHIGAGELQAVIAEEKARLQAYIRRFHFRPRAELRGHRVLIVDDGLATGATMEAAVHSAKKQLASAVVVAVPVASENAVVRLGQIADRVIAVLVDPGFDAVGRYYEHFPQTTDEEVITCLVTEEKERLGELGESGGSSGGVAGI